MDEGCQDTAGFLFKHACSNAATGECAQCGKRICKAHTKAGERGMPFCVGCLKQELAQGGKSQRPSDMGRRAKGKRRRGRSYDQDPYFYGDSHYEGYGSYRRGHWGHGYYQRSRHDPNDFSEADGEAFATEGDEGWENDMGAS